MRRSVLLCAWLVVALPQVGNAAPRLVLWLPEEAAALQPAMEEAFAWAPTVVVLSPAHLAARFPASPAAVQRQAAQKQMVTLLAEARRAFIETRFADASSALSRCLALLERLPPSAASHQTWVRARLLQGRVALAQRDAAAATRAFAEAAGAAPQWQLDEGDYPPEVCRAYEAARQEVARRARRAVTVESSPTGADVEINGRMWGRTPTRVKLPPGRCRLSITLPGFQPHVAACPSTHELQVELRPAPRPALHDQLRERLRNDRRWFVERSVLDPLAAEVGVDWVLAFEPSRGASLATHFYDARRHRVRPLQPARYGRGELRELARNVRDTITDAEGLRAKIRAPLSRVPEVEAWAGDPAAVVRVTLFVRATGRQRYHRHELAPGDHHRFIGRLPPAVVGTPGMPIAVDYYVEGLDAQGHVHSRVGSPTDPQRFSRAGLPVSNGEGPRVTPWYARWYVWTAVGAAVLGASLGTYFALRPSDVAITLGRR